MNTVPIEIDHIKNYVGFDFKGLSYRIRKQGIAYVYCGRGSKGGKPAPLGNPFPVNKNTSREEAIAKFSEYLNREVEKGNNGIKSDFFVALSDLKRLYLKGKFDNGDVLKKIVLICWCFPASCHTEVIRDYLLRRQ